MSILKNAYLFDKKFITILGFFFYLIFLYCSYLFIIPEELFKIYGNNRALIAPTVHVIGKAAIGQYLWLHLLNGSLSTIGNGFFQTGNKTFNNIVFHYLSGPGYIQTTIPQDIQFLVLILNGRTSKNVIKAKQWLDFLPELRSLEKIAIILLGNEKCQNQWISQYMKSKGGIIDVLFVVYDSDLVDNKEIFQWPLGVATYRGFPNLPLNMVKYIHSPRKYKCNFIGTIYENSSREIVNVTLRNGELKSMCFLSARPKWKPEESTESLSKYLNVLQSSDFTLNPVGQNTECYRIYEAASLGSIPIIEDSMTPGTCVSPLRLLKSFDPPFIFVKNWTTLNSILQKDKTLNFKNVVERRKNLLAWYGNFKNHVVIYFLNILKESFFPS